MNAASALSHDLIIVGAGPAGLSFARSLADTGLRIAIVERLSRAELADPPFDGREIALTHPSVELLQALDIWPRIDPDAIAPLRDAEVRNGRSQRSIFFDHRDSHREQLGYLVPNHLIRRAAWASAVDANAAEVITDARVTAVDSDEHSAQVTLEDGRVLRAALIVAADSRFSETRRAMGIAARMQDFGKTMLVCRMRHERPHQQVAREWFDYGATLALLPLNGDVSSVVLTQPHRDIAPLTEMDADAFARQIESRLDGHLGRMELISTRHAYPLVAVYADRFYGRRYALIGDAAVGMHPVTAHGFNFGLSGQALLSREIRRAVERGSDIGLATGLARYASAHRRATAPLYTATNAIVRLYTDDRLPARIARDAALRVGHRLAPFRQAVIHTLTAEGANDPLAAAGAALRAGRSMLPRLGPGRG
ncbi:MAG: 5-demethoxyubiquinol-8 5-hydroxylase UbiM [Nevskiales bacterium]|nr:5-demethoxyubiquinol-8 5-hydroxylase UbiM [Nevskiales bacterium]